MGACLCQSEFFTRAADGLNRREAMLGFLAMGGSGAWMMLKVAEKNKLAPPEELFEMCIELGVNLWPCQMTMDLLGVQPAQMVEGLGEPVGAATALQKMAKSDINLFI